jgi:hypothetical protein
MQIRPEVESDEVIVYLTTANGGLTTNASGVVQIFMAASTTAAIDRDGVYDIEIVANGNGEVTRPLKGKVRLDPEVTR